MNILMLVGSPKPKGSVSEILGSCLVRKLEQLGHKNISVNTAKTIRTEPGLQELKETYSYSDLLVIAYPLYIDTLPYPLISALEHLSELKTTNPKKVLAICNCGFPESSQCSISLSNIELFTKQTGNIWLGGFALGAGGAIAGMTRGRKLEESGGMFRNVIKAFDLITDSIDKNTSIPEEAFKLFSKPLMPKWLYTTMGNLGWNSMGKKNGLSKKELYKRPYEQD